MTVDQLKNNGIFVGSSLTYPKRSITVILAYVTKDEKLLAVTYATFGVYGDGAIAVTNKRFIYAKYKLFGKSIFMECDVNLIDFVEYSNNVLRIEMNDEELFFESIAPEAGDPFVMHLPIKRTAMSGFDIMLASIDKRKLLGS